MRLRYLLLLLCLLCVGCNNQNKQQVDESYKVYESYIDTVVNNKQVQSQVIPFNYKMEVEKKDNLYVYEINIYNPQVAMYDIKAIAVDQNLDSNTNVYPCIGLLGEDAKNHFSMIPYQAYGKKGFVKMITLDAVSEKSEFTINVMVTWKDRNMQKENRVFFNCYYVEKKGDGDSGNKTTSDAGKSDANGK